MADESCTLIRDAVNGEGSEGKMGMIEEEKKHTVCTVHINCGDYS